MVGRAVRRGRPGRVSPESRCAPVATNDEGQRTGQTTSPYNPRSKVEATAAQLRARRAAAARCVPLDCGCADPWPCRCTRPPLSERTVDGYRDAARHVLGHGSTPALPLEVLQALWRRGGPDRELADELYKLGGVS